VLHFNLKILASILLLFLSCEEIEYNPLDSVNPDYISPETTITSDIDGSTLDTTVVTITFAGNDEVTEYSYSADNSGWSSWTAATSYTMDYLDEGQHNFSVKGRYASGDEDESPAAISFTVDAVKDSSLRLYPLRHIISVDSTITCHIMAEGVDSLMSATIILSYDTASLEIISVSQGDIFTNTGESVFIAEENSGTITIHTMYLGGDNPYVSGTGSLAVILVKALAPGSHTLSLDGTQILKTHTNRPISIIETVNGLVVIE
jgi:hypothetical protein